MPRSPRLHPAVGLVGPLSIPTTKSQTTSRSCSESSSTGTTTSSNSISKSSISKDTSSIYSAGIGNFEAYEKSNKAKKAWKSLKHHVKEHHRSMNSAYKAYYGVGSNIRWEYKGHH